MGWRSGINTTIYTDKVDMNVTTPVFMDSIGEDDEKNERDLKELEK